MTRSKSKKELVNQKLKFQRIVSISAIVVVAAIAITVSVFLTSANPKIDRTTINKQTSMGDINAPVKVEEFGDYQCPACGEFFAQIEPELVTKYINTGKVYFTFTAYSFIGPESIAAAQASFCALDQGKFWEYHDMLYENQNGENQGSFSDTNLKGFAINLGLNIETFSGCMSNQKYAALVQDNVRYGKSMQVASVPYFLVNGKQVYRFSLLDTIDSALKADGK
jgi:protein-disulfide isomerase